MQRLSGDVVRIFPSTGEHWELLISYCAHQILCRLQFFINVDYKMPRESNIMVKSWYQTMNICRDAVRFTVYSLIVVLILTGCAGTPVIYPHTPGHVGALRVAEIMELKSGKELPKIYFQALKDSGISDTKIQQGTLAAGRVYCCGGSNEIVNIIMVFIPQEVSVEPGDIVEVKMGKAPEQGKLGIVNIATRVREKHEGRELPKWGSSGDRTNQSCRWIPEESYLWHRILYCDWMKEEGWIEYEGFLWDTWMKPQ